MLLDSVNFRSVSIEGVNLQLQSYPPRMHGNVYRGDFLIVGFSRLCITLGFSRLCITLGFSRLCMTLGFSRLCMMIGFNGLYMTVFSCSENGVIGSRKSLLCAG